MPKAIASSAMEALIIKACGARSMTEFAKACDVSPMHISRIKSGICRPSKKMCIKLGNEPYVRQIGLSTEDFMRAAGYEEDIEIKSTQSFERLVMKSLNTVALGMVSKKLMERGIAFQMVPSADCMDADFTFEVLGHDKIKQLCICVAQPTYESSDRFIFFYSIGRILTIKMDENRQYMMIMSDEAIFDELGNSPEIADIRENVTIVLLDTEQMAFRKEVHLGADEEYISFIK